MEIDQIISFEFANAQPQIVSGLLEYDQVMISHQLKRFADDTKCDLIITTGGTGSDRRDVTPEATRAVIDKELPGFGEVMRVKSYVNTPTTILSRATAGIRGKTLMINLPGSPHAIRECLPLLSPAIRECLEHLKP
ncbi:MAG: MogA/MoaB family molybdenum cofactor biosynthesis protein [Verrucomicrobiota bacterium]